jgi:peptidyl-prolyl cis-trans isomerase D
MGFEMTDDYFWNQIQYDQMFAQQKQFLMRKVISKLRSLKNK